MKRFLLSLMAAVVCFCAESAVPVLAGTVAEYRHLVLAGQTLKWGDLRYGSGADVSYAVVETTHRFPEARNCGAIRQIDELLAGSSIERGIFARELGSALRAWENVANIRFHAVQPEKADILIGAQVAPVGRAFTNVTFEQRSGSGIEDISAAVICLNPLERWKIGFDGNLDVYDLRHTLMHEVGHAIGLDHPGAGGGIMGFAYTEEFANPQPGDIKGAVSLYGLPQHHKIAVDNAKAERASTFPSRPLRKAPAFRIP